MTGAAGIDLTDADLFVRGARSNFMLGSTSLPVRVV